MYSPGAVLANPDTLTVKVELQVGTTKEDAVRRALE
jgi:hypothetical protein